MTTCLHRLSPGFDSDRCGGAHDVIVADIDRDGRQGVILLADGSSPTNINELRGYRIAADPKQSWQRHRIGPPVHGAISPAGAADTDGDLVCQLGGHELVVGDVDGDGDIDIYSKPSKNVPWNGAGGRQYIDFLENKRIDRKATSAQIEKARGPNP